MGKVGQIVTGLIAIGAGFAVKIMYTFITGTIGAPESVVNLPLVIEGARWLLFGLGGILIFYALVTGLFGGKSREEYRRPPPEEGRREPRERREPERRDERQEPRREEEPQDQRDEGGSDYTERINQARRQQDER